MNISEFPVEYQDYMSNAIRYACSKGVYPEYFRKAKIKPIPKKGDFNLVKNRRFITIGCIEQQLMSKSVASMVLDFCETNNLIDDNQYGFRKSHSTTHAIANTYEYIINNIDSLIANEDQSKQYYNAGYNGT